MHFDGVMDAPVQRAMEGGESTGGEIGGKSPIWRYCGPRIKAARERRGLSVPELAEQVGIAETTLRNIERGAHGTGVHNLLQIAEILEYPVTDFLPPQKALALDEVDRIYQRLSRQQKKAFLRFIEVFAPDLLRDLSPC